MNKCLYILNNFNVLFISNVINMFFRIYIINILDKNSEGIVEIFCFLVIQRNSPPPPGFFIMSPFFSFYSTRKQESEYFYAFNV
jgi:hypothetical protein